MKKEAMLYEKMSGTDVHCFLCSHHCRIKNNDFGKCRVRQNQEGILYTHVYGVSIATHVDPVEKKPLYHFLPGSLVYSIGTVGCNFSCDFCQNWQISQTADGRKSEKDFGMALPPQDVVAGAADNGCQSIAYTYTEPTIFFEYAYDTARLGRKAGLYNIFVTNGFMTEQALDTIAPFLDGANVDLKSWRQDYYRTICNGRLQPVLKSIQHLHQKGIWVEITTLLIPGENDSREELEGIAGFIAELDANIPWHLSAFHPSYQLMNRPATTMEILENARRIGHEAGLRYVYLGNVAAPNDTVCFHCGKTVVKRDRLSAQTVELTGGHCPVCSTEIAGRWRNSPAE